MDEKTSISETAHPHVRAMRHKCGFAQVNRYRPVAKCPDAFAPEHAYQIHDAAFGLRTARHLTNVNNGAAPRVLYRSPQHLMRNRGDVAFSEKQKTKDIPHGVAFVPFEITMR
jgi:hypothetical protein